MNRNKQILQKARALADKAGVDWHQVIAPSGHVHIRVTNPVTGRSRKIIAAKTVGKQGRGAENFLACVRRKIRELKVEEHINEGTSIVDRDYCPVPGNGK